MAHTDQETAELLTKANFTKGVVADAQIATGSYRVELPGYSSHPVFADKGDALIACTAMNEWANWNYFKATLALLPKLREAYEALGKTSHLKECRVFSAIFSDPEVECTCGRDSTLASIKEVLEPDEK